MITKMIKYTFLVFHRDYESFLKRLRDVGVLHVTEKAEAFADDQLLEQQFVLRDELRKTINRAEQYLVNDAHIESLEESNLTGEQVQALMSELRQLEDEHQQLQQSLAATRKEADRMAVWGDFSESREKQLLDNGIRLRYFTCPKKQYDEAWETLYNAVPVAEQSGRVYFVAVSRDNEEFELDAEEVKLNAHSSRQLQTDADAVEHLLVA